MAQCEERAGAGYSTLANFVNVKWIPWRGPYLRSAVNMTLPLLIHVYVDFLTRKIQALGPD